MQNHFEPIVAVDDKAKAMILEILNQEPDNDELGLVVNISGLDGMSFSYSLAMMRIADTAPNDHIVKHDGLSLIVPDADVANLTGATIKVSVNLLQPGLVIDNPNGPSPTILGDQSGVDLSGSVAERATQVVNEMINPAIASHGGRAEIAGVEDGVAYIRFGGGCQGCGMASVTLSQGIESSLVEMVPEITKVIDVTDHAGGDNPYYEAAKK
ncbi:MAG: NifU family protein [Acidimicrobiia bacterium]|nr:NifU family protein [Acidimicrobiia bacterium]MDX2467383.1 NifU family protein [Acidimicrobiia bacterium]